MQGVFAFDDSAQHEAKEWLLDLKRMTDLTQFSELFSLLGKANTVRTSAITLALCAASHQPYFIASHLCSGRHL